MADGRAELVCTDDGTHRDAVKKPDTAHLFPANAAVTPRIGAEVEMLVRHRGSGAIATLDAALGEWLRCAADRAGWVSLSSTKGAPKFRLASGSTITLEPGGQLEIITKPHASPHALVRDIQEQVRELSASADEFSLVLAAAGIDPLHTLEETPLQLDAERYARMDAYFNTISSAGARMMRQTAAFQLSIDAAHDPALTWCVLNRAAPVLTALFANSRMYNGRDSGYASYRAQMWRELDATRTGTHETADAYAAFALAARSIEDDPLYRRFRDIPGTTSQQWANHLTTLFPEVRPNQYFEMRCIDAIPPLYAAAPVLIVAALAWDCDMLRAAAQFLPAADDERLLRAARLGMEDEGLASDARRLVELTLEVCERLRGSRGAGDDAESFASDADIAALTAWLERSLATHGASLENDFVRDDHIPDDALARFGK
jgi:glutamate--cysteine ligase